jgi:predicted nucleic acid-binding protein
LNLLVDTSVWSLALRRDRPPDSPALRLLSSALASGDSILTTGLVLQELLQGFNGPAAREAILDRFRAIHLVVPDRRDHVEAADLRNACRRRGSQIGTIDALLAQLCLRHELTMLTTDRDFARIAEVRPFDLWPTPLAG